MKRSLVRTMLFVLLPMLAVPGVWAAAQKTNPADYPITVHVSSAQYAATNSLDEILTVTIDGKHYQLLGPTSSARLFSHGNGLLNLGDYQAKLVNDTHKTAYESVQQYELLMPDGTTRPFGVVFQGE